MFITNESKTTPVENSLGSVDRNFIGTDGFEFVEFTAADVTELDRMFRQLGFRIAARHRSKQVTLYRQGDVNFIVNAEPNSFAQAFARVHGPSACAFAMRVDDAAAAYARALDLGTKPYHGPVGPMEINIPAIMGIGNSLNLPGRQIRRQHHLRCRLCRCRSRGGRWARRRRPARFGSPDPQRVPRPHGCLG